MSSASPIATVLVLPDRRPLTARILAAIGDLTADAAETHDRDAQCSGRAVLFRGEPGEALRLDQALRRAGLTTSVNTLC